MTQRIYELFEQTLKEFKQEHKYATIMLPEPLREKFAELIVRECIDWCNAHARDDGTAQRIAEDIKKDFGVEE